MRLWLDDNVPTSDKGRAVGLIVGLLIESRNRRKLGKTSLLTIALLLLQSRARIGPVLVVNDVG